MACYYKDVNGVFWIFDQVEDALDFLKATSENVNTNPKDYGARDIDVVDGSATGDYDLRVKCVEAYNKLRQSEGVDPIKYSELPMPERRPPAIAWTGKGRFNPPTIPPRKGTGR